MYQLRSPDAALNRFIEHYWFVRSDAATPFDLTVKVFVDARADLILNFGVPYRRTVLGGGTESISHSNLDAQRLQPIEIAQQGHVVLAGVRFRAGGLAPFVRQSLHEWTDRIVPLDEAFSEELEHRLRDREVDDQARLLDAYFLSRLRITPPIESFFESMTQLEEGTGRVDQLDVAIRRVDRLFRAHLGITPKTYIRVLRFQRALRRLMQQPGVTLGQVALECGYSDQAHFVREHRRFAGGVPTAQVGYFPATAPTDFSPNLVQFIQDATAP